MHKLKILMIVPNLGTTNGVTSFVMTYFRQLEPVYAQMDFVLLYDIGSQYYKEIHNLGGKIYILSPANDFGKIIQKSKRILKHGHYDVVVDNSLILTLPIMICAKHYGVPVRILHSHNTRLSDHWMKEKIEKIGLPLLKKQCTDFCACGKEAGKFLFGNDPFTVIPNVISIYTNKFDSERRLIVRDKMRVSNQIVIGTVGRISTQKNPFFAIKVISALIKKIPNLTYWWIGSGEMDQELREYVKSRGLDQAIHFLGNRNDISDLYQAIDIFFLPSLFEGLPLTGVEAQAFGIPCVVSSSITNEMVYTDLVKFVSLQAPINEWLRTFEEQMQLIPNRRSYTNELKESQFSAEGAGERLIKIYQNMLSRNSK